MVFLLLDQNLEVLNHEVFPQSTPSDDDDSDDNVQCCFSPSTQFIQNLVGLLPS
jgi:hypothetical protein